MEFLRRLRSSSKRWLFCRVGQHERVIVRAVINGHALSYSRLATAAIIAEVRCIHCPHTSEVAHANAQVILQKPKELR